MPSSTMRQQRKTLQKFDVGTSLITFFDQQLR